MFLSPKGNTHPTNSFESNVKESCSGLLWSFNTTWCVFETIVWFQLKGPHFLFGRKKNWNKWLVQFAIIHHAVHHPLFDRSDTPLKPTISYLPSLPAFVYVLQLFLGMRAMPSLWTLGPVPLQLRPTLKVFSQKLPNVLPSYDMDRCITSPVLMEIIPILSFHTICRLI